ncbi:MAG: transcriptional repressor [Caulobacterales bacterium]
MAHDHTHIDIGSALAAATTHCSEVGETLTPLRRRVLELLLARRGPAKAYDLLADMGDASGPAKPPSVYRALEFLVRLGLAHRLESVNAFVACDIGSCARAKIFLICDQCGQVTEVDAGHAQLDIEEAALRDQFAIKRAVLEASGLCHACRSAA